MTEKQSFVLKQPVDMKPKAVVQAAKARGIDLTANYVWMIRREQRRRQQHRPSARRPPLRPAEVKTTRGEQQFVELAFEIGLSSATELLADARDRFRAILQ